MSRNINYIALLRGINVGGHKRVLMAELRTVLSKAGFENLQTYIQSGNVIFKSSINSTQVLEATIKAAILDYFGFEVPVIVREQEHLLRIFDKCPFSEEKKKNSYFALLSQCPETSLVIEASKKRYANEEFEILQDCIYFYSAKGYGNSKFSLNFFEKKLNVNATARNYKTMVKLLSLSQK